MGRGMGLRLALLTGQHNAIELPSDGPSVRRPDPLTWTTPKVFVADNLPALLAYQH